MYTLRFHFLRIFNWQFFAIQKQLGQMTKSLRAKIHKKMYFEKVIIDKKLFNKYFAP